MCSEKGHNTLAFARSDRVDRPMPHHFRSGVLLAALLAAIAAMARSSDPLARETPVPADQQIPVIDFFRPAQFITPKLSPDGRHYAAMVTADVDRRGVLICEIDKGTFGKIDPVGLKDVYWFRWLTADHLLYKLAEEKRYARGIYVAGVPSVRKIFTYPIERYSATSVLGAPRSDLLHPIIWVRKNAFEGGEDSGVFQVDAARSTIKNRDSLPGIRGSREDTETERYGLEASVVRTFAQLPAGIPVSYLADVNGELAFGISASDGFETLYRYSGGTWSKCPIDLEGVDIVEIGDKPGELLVMETGDSEKPHGIRRMDSIRGAMGETIFADALYDAQTAEVHRQPLTDRVVGIGVERARWQNFWLDSRYADIEKSVAQQFPQECVNIVGADDKENRFFIATWSDRKPTTYYLADLEKKTFSKVASTRPWIDPERARPMNIVRYKARDGIEIEGYLTLPAGASKAAPVPLVVLPHGGPWTRDVWAWDAEPQFFASRGYAVFQPNYRGSDSYAWRFPAGDLWAFRKMHNDVVDGLNAMKRTGLIDADRVAIMGSSFGGYLALCGAAFEPETYRCAITISGVFDWDRMIREVKNLDDDSVRSKRLIRKLGDPEKNRSYFEDISPAQHLDSVKIPIFVAHGKSDQVVDVQQSKRLVTELERRGIPCVAQFESGEGHGMAFLENRIELYTKIEQFLAANLAPRSAATPAAAGATK